MFNLTLYQVDAFAENPFCGNPAAVIILPQRIELETMQNIAMENNLSETAFLVKCDTYYEIRYFTPVMEVELCGHATLASAFVLFNFINHPQNIIQIRTKMRGDLYVEKKNDLLELDFPIDRYTKTHIPAEAIEVLKIQPIEAYWGLNDLMLVYQNEEEILQLDPNFDLMKKVKTRGILVTAPGKEVDFVSRFFAPLAGINEDPVTGSAHTTLIPYWAQRLGKHKMIARQLSKRGGTIYCELAGERVKIGGKAIHYLTGEISI